MKCAQCQNEMTAQERFCSRCGRDSGLDRTQAIPPRVLETHWEVHVKVFAWILIGCAALMALPGFGLLFGQSFMMMAHPRSFGRPFLALLGLLVLTVPTLIICVGVALLQYREWGRICALVLSALLVILFPFGTALGIYGFWVLTSQGGSANYRMNSTRLAT